jgi:plastocyanin
MKTIFKMSGLFVMGAMLMLAFGCGAKASSSSTPPATSTTISATTPSSVSISLTASNMAFDKSTITVRAGASVTINFSNQDSGVPHNFAVYTNSSATTSIFVGTRVTGVTSTTYTFTAPTTPGNYFFRCDVHPTIMNGTFVVTAS